MELSMPARSLYLLLALVGVTAARPVRADFVWEFDLAGVPTTNFIIPTIGGTVGVDIYLKENGGTVLATQGLIGAGVQLKFDSPTGVAAVLPVGSDSSGIQLNPAFNDTTFAVRDVTATNAKLSESVTNPNAPVFPVALNRIYFGTFTFTALSAGDVTITATRFGTASQTAIVTGDFNTLDGTFPDATAHIIVPGVATPEPGTLVLASLAGMGLAGFGIRRRHRGEGSVTPGK